MNPGSEKKKTTGILINYNLPFNLFVDIGSSKRLILQSVAQIIDLEVNIGPVVLTGFRCGRYLFKKMIIKFENKV